MSFPVYLDEHVDPALARLLRSGGYDVLTTNEAGLANIQASDEDQLAHATSLGRAILTHNVRDFLALAIAWASAEREHSGIIVSKHWPPDVLYRRLQTLLDEHPKGIHNLCLWLP